MSIIEELYYGNIRPLEMKYSKIKDYKNALEEYLNNETEFLDSLSKEKREMFDKLMESKLCLDAITETEKFKDGFKLGIKLMWECFK